MTVCVSLYLGKSFRFLRVIINNRDFILPLATLRDSPCKEVGGEGMGCGTIPAHAALCCFMTPIGREHKLSPVWGLQELNYTTDIYSKYATATA